MSNLSQWLSSKIPVPSASEIWTTPDTNVHFPSIAVTAYLSYLMVGKFTALTYSVILWQKLTHQGQWLGVIHHAANMSAMIDGVMHRKVPDFCYCHIFASQPLQVYSSQVLCISSPKVPRNTVVQPFI